MKKSIVTPCLVCRSRPQTGRACKHSNSRARAWRPPAGRGAGWLLCFCLLLAGFIMPGTPRAAEPGTGSATLTVQVREVRPFAYRDGGHWRGIAIDLWNQIAADLGYGSEFIVSGLEPLLDGLANGEIGVGLGALSVTAERESRFDFSHPFYRASLGVAVPDQRIDGWERFMRAISSPTFLGAVTALLTLLATVGALVWMAERRHNSQFPRDLPHGVGAGIWWSSVTMTTVGYGDKSPITFTGRLIAMVWMFMSLIIVSTVTASLTASFTLDALNTDIASEAELASLRTGTVAGSTSETRLGARGIRPRLYPDIERALAALAAGDIEAVVYDRPLLRYAVAQDYVGRLRVLGLEFAPQDYAFAFKSESPLREQVNRRLLVHGRGVEWDRLVTRYLGDDR